MIEKNSWVLVTPVSDLWTPNEDGNYPQPRVDRLLIDDGKMIYERSKTVYHKETPDVTNRMGRVAHIIQDPDVPVEEREEQIYCVVFNPDLMEQCIQDWYLCRATDMEVVEPTDDEIGAYFEEWL